MRFLALLLFCEEGIGFTVALKGRETKMLIKLILIESINNNGTKQRTENVLNKMH